MNIMKTTIVETIRYDDPKKRAVSKQIEEVKEEVAFFTTNTDKLKRSLDPKPFYKLVKCVKIAINEHPHAFGHLSNIIGTVQDLILNNAHKFADDFDKENLLSLEQYLGNKRASREGENMHKLSSPPAQALSQLTQSANETRKGKVLRKTADDDLLWWNCDSAVAAELDGLEPEKDRTQDVFEQTILDDFQDDEETSFEKLEKSSFEFTWFTS